MAKIFSNNHPATSASLSHILWVTIFVTSFIVFPSTARSVGDAETTTTDHMITTTPPTSTPSASNDTHNPHMATPPSSSLLSWTIPKFTVYIVYGLDRAFLRVRCQSLQEDIGMRVLSPSEREFSFSFYMNTAFFSCNFYYGNDRISSPVVFSYQLVAKYPSWNFYWMAVEEGVIFSTKSDFSNAILWSDYKWHKPS